MAGHGRRDKTHPGGILTMFNNVVLIGRLVRDPEIKYTAGSGTAWTTFTLAVDRPFVKRETGEREADFIDVSTWRKLAENCAKFLAKGGQAGPSISTC